MSDYWMKPAPGAAYPSDQAVAAAYKATHPPLPLASAEVAVAAAYPVVREDVLREVVEALRAKNEVEPHKYLYRVAADFIEQRFLRKEASA